jgi:hypothetical protein
MIELDIICAKGIDNFRPSRLFMNPSVRFIVELIRKEPTTARLGRRDEVGMYVSGREVWAGRWFGSGTYCLSASSLALMTIPVALWAGFVKITLAP